MMRAFLSSVNRQDEKQLEIPGKKKIVQESHSPKVK